MTGCGRRTGGGAGHTGLGVGVGVWVCCAVLCGWGRGQGVGKKPNVLHMGLAKEWHHSVDCARVWEGHL